MDFFDVVFDLNSYVTSSTHNVWGQSDSPSIGGKLCCSYIVYLGESVQQRCREVGQAATDHVNFK